MPVEHRNRVELFEVRNSNGFLVENHATLLIRNESRGRRIAGCFGSTLPALRQVHYLRDRLNASANAGFV